MAFCSSLKCVTEVKQNSSFLVRDSWCAGWSCEDNGSRAGKTLAVSTDCRAMGAGSRLFPPPDRSVAVSWGRTLGWHCFFWVPPVSKCLPKCMCLKKWEQNFIHSFKFVDIDVSGKTLSVRMGTASTTKFWEVGRRRFRAQHNSGSMRRRRSLTFCEANAAQREREEIAEELSACLSSSQLERGFGNAKDAISPSPFVVSK